MKIKMIETGAIVEKSDFVAKLFIRKGKAKLVKEEKNSEVETKEEKFTGQTKAKRMPRK